MSASTKTTVTQRVGVSSVGLAFLATAAGCSEEGAPYDTDPIGSVEEAVHTVCLGSSRVEGIDVSHYQGSISASDWSQVKAAGKLFAFTKATESINYQDSEFANNWSGMKSAGVIRGAYHFFRPAVSGSAQADYLVDFVNASGGFLAGDLPPVVDVEVTDRVSASTINSRLSDFVNRIATRTGKKAIVYVSAYFWQDNVGPNSSGFTSSPLWGANYTTGCPLLPDPWSKATFWQYSNSGTVAGISGLVDLDQFNGTLAELKAFTG